MWMCPRYVFTSDYGSFWERFVMCKYIWTYVWLSLLFQKLQIRRDIIYVTNEINT